MFKFSNKNHVVLNIFKIINKNTRNNFVYFFLTTRKMKLFINNCNKIRSFLRIWSDLPKKSFTENFIFIQWLLYHYSNLLISSLSLTMYFPTRWRLYKTLGSCTFQEPIQGYIGSPVKPLGRSFDYICRKTST